ncbi:FecR family protein [Alteromonadaceae bacterium Bs31]|nr:FecR family protein [Alteromonadaceae bacterium Bs31]
MSKVVPIQQSELINDTASLWIARLDRELNDEEMKDLKAWLAQSTLHRDALIEMAELWDQMDCLSRLATLFPEKGVVATEKRKGFQLNHLTVYAASITLVLSVAIASLLALSTDITLPEDIVAAFGGSSYETGIYETEIGEFSSVTLSDGSSLVINTDTLVRVRYQENLRLLYLERGEIHIKVAHDKSRPLSVIAGSKVVQAVGTAFNVQRLGGDNVELIVTDGEVLATNDYIDTGEQNFKSLKLDDSALALSQGEIVVLGVSDTTIDKIDSSEIEATLSWRQGNLIFRGETLEQALQEVSRYTGVEFNIADSSIKSLRIAGMYKAGDVNGLLLALKQNFNIYAEKDSKNNVTLHAI